MQSTSRRNFLKTSALATASLMVPEFLSKAFSNPVAFNGKSLVIIQLAGGNDGLNCVVPYSDDLYYKNRPSVALQDDQLLRINDTLAFNKSLDGLMRLYDQGALAVINSVGYPNPDRSHFRSMDIWQSASNANEYESTGWIGRFLDSSCAGKCAGPHQAVELDGALSLALKGHKSKGFAFNDFSSLQVATSNNLLKQTAENFRPDAADDSYNAFLHKTLAETVSSAAYILDHSKTFKSKMVYPNHDFGRKMKMISSLIRSGLETSVYYVSLPGFDTHVFQKGTHNRLLKTYSETLFTFCNDLMAANRFKDTLVLTFSEFGRRVKQNAGNGTDHGTANNVFIAGGALKTPGIFNAPSNLSNLDDGDLKFEIDFRRIYATLLEKWLDADVQQILKTRFEPLSII